MLDRAILRSLEARAQIIEQLGDVEHLLIVCTEHLLKEGDLGEEGHVLPGFGPGL